MQHEDLDSVSQFKRQLGLKIVRFETEQSMKRVRKVKHNAARHKSSGFVKMKSLKILK